MNVGGGTRLTVVAHEKTRFTEPGLTSLKDGKKDDEVVMHCLIQDSPESHVE
jgi:hypothetical protein